MLSGVTRDGHLAGVFLGFGSKILDSQFGESLGFGDPAQCPPFGVTCIQWRALFSTPFLQGLFFAPFFLVRKSKNKGRLTDYRRKNGENFG